MKKIPDIINRLWNVCGQMEVGALLTCGSGINENKMHTKYSGFTVPAEEEMTMLEMGIQS